ncbi:MAG TPA: STAS domain-containing protein [Lacipirellulaceae bacterium]|nr:STAS domain-containing protein [Lacipirellulaceae bacterium]
MVPVEKQGAVCVLRPQTPLAGDQCGLVLAAAVQGLGAGRPMLVVDLHNVPLLDSSGLEMLLDLRDRIEARGGAVKLAAASPLCCDILRVTGVGEKFEQYEVVKSAVGSFAE